MINQEEYKVLRSYFFRGIRWISRNKNGDLVVSKVKPDKFERKWLPQCPDEDWSELRNSETYPFSSIQWKDEEPCDIAELIDEYEREEIKVKKNLEWLKEKVRGIVRQEGDKYSYIHIQAVLQLIDQLDKPEADGQLDKLANFIMSEVEGEPSQNQGVVDAAIRIIKSYQSQEVLSLKWIDDNSVYASHGGITDEYVHVDDLKEMLVPKQELPVIPEYMPGYLEKAKADIDLMRVMDIAYNHNEIDKFNKHYDWIRDNHELFARAWMDGYTVEKEQRYYVLDPKGIPLLGRGNGQAYKTTTALRIHETCMDKSQYALTEQEIKDYDKRFWAFAVPAKELEE